MGYSDRCNVNELKGKVILKIDGKKGDDELIFYCSNGDSYKMYHDQDCCESVHLEDVCGDLNNLINSEILLSEEVSNLGDIPPLDEDWDESYTWTYYNIATHKGFITLRWYGTSNGYYSESIDFEKINQ